MISTTLLYTTSPKYAWISSYKFMKSWHFHLTLREIFSSFGQVFIPTSWHFFTWLCDDFFKMANMKVIEDVSSFPKHPRAWIYHTWARRFKDLKLDIHSWFTRQICDEQGTKILTMLHNLHFAGLLTWKSIHNQMFTQLIEPLSKWFKYCPLHLSIFGTKAPLPFLQSSL